MVSSPCPHFRQDHFSKILLRLWDQQGSSELPISFVVMVSSVYFQFWLWSLVFQHSLRDYTAASFFWNVSSSRQNPSLLAEICCLWTLYLHRPERESNFRVQSSVKVFWCWSLQPLHVLEVIRWSSPIIAVLWPLLLYTEPYHSVMLIIIELKCRRQHTMFHCIYFPF